MRAAILVTISLLLLIPQQLPAGEGEPVLLSYRHPEGQQAVYKIKRSIDLEMDKLDCRVLLEHKCIERLTGLGDDGILNLSILYKDLTESITVGGKPGERGVYSLLIDRPFGIQLSPQGALTGFTSPNVDAVDIYNLELVELLVPGLELYSRLSAPALPDRPVRVGDTWTAEREYGASFAQIGKEAKVKVASTFEVKKAKKEKGSWCFEIQEKSTFTSHEIYVFGDQVMSAEGSGNGEGKLLFDYERGLIRKYESKIRLDGEATIIRGVTQEVGGQKSVNSWDASTASDLRAQAKTGPAKITISYERELKKVEKAKKR